jgi:cytochrome c biogenesis protein
MGLSALWTKFYKTLASIRTGVILLIIVVLFSAAGTFVMQRPTSEPGQLERAYSPSTLALLDRIGLTDVFHSWWFLSLLALVSLSIIFASLERWPNAWRFYARPYRRPEPHFRAALAHRTSIPIRNADEGIEAAERAFRKLRLPTERISGTEGVSLYSEKHRFAVLAVYVIHASLLFIFLGGIVDGLMGYRGFMSIDEGQTTNQFSVRTAMGEFPRTLPFSIRCDEARQENYKDAEKRDTGMPKKYWSKLDVIENGQVTRTKQIIVNDPLVYHGIRLFQASMGQSGTLRSATLEVKDADGKSQVINIKPGMTAPLGPDTSITLAKFVPDFYIQDNEVYNKSESPNNPALGFVVTKARQKHQAWIFPANSMTADVPALSMKLTLTGGDLANFTGLEVSYEPGQWAVWTGCLLMGIGLVIAFYIIHMRFWAIAVHDEKQGLVLWVGGAFNKNKERFEDKYKALVAAIEREIQARESQPPITNTRNKKAKESARETTTVVV